MTEKVSNREMLSREVEALNDDQVLEVLEYISIMNTLRDQEVKPRKEADATPSLSQRRDSKTLLDYTGQEGDVVLFPGSRRAASK